MVKVKLLLAGWNWGIVENSEDQDDYKPVCRGLLAALRSGARSRGYSGPPNARGGPGYHRTPGTPVLAFETQDPPGLLIVTMKGRFPVEYKKRLTMV
jgi:hypothetical protein